MPHDLPSAMAISSPTLELGVGEPTFLPRWQSWLESLEPEPRAVVQIRAKTVSASVLYRIVELAKRVVRRNLLVVNGRVDIALALRVDGVQLPEGGLPVAQVRSLMGPDFWIGRSVHDLDGVRLAVAEGVDWVTLAPIFQPLSKQTSTPELGVEALAEAASFGVPVFALGGVTPVNSSLCFNRGAHGVAGITLFAPSSASTTTNSSTPELPASDIIHSPQEVDPSGA